MGGYPPQGILLEGPPGTGKTLLSKAIAGEVNVPFIYASASSFSSMFMGIGNLKVMRLFTKARKFSERYGGAVIFMDELDAIGSRGGVAQTMEPYPFHEPFRHGLEGGYWKARRSLQCPAASQASLTESWVAWGWAGCSSTIYWCRWTDSSSRKASVGSCGV